jgi:hypothetical protein
LPVLSERGRKTALLEFDRGIEIECYTAIELLYGDRTATRQY